MCAPWSLRSNPSGKSRPLGLSSACGGDLPGGALRPLGVRPWMAFAVGLVIVVGGALLASRWLPGPPVAQHAPEVPAIEPAPPAAPIAAAWARLGRRRDCRWAATSQTIVSAEALPNARMVELSEGLVELAFPCGATATVRGPSAFKVAGPNALHLERGELSAQVDSAQCGEFVVSTPTVRVVDRGTAFAVRVASQGEAEVDVFQGVVEAARVEANQPPEKLRRRHSPPGRRSHSRQPATHRRAGGRSRPPTPHRRAGRQRAVRCAGRPGRERFAAIRPWSPFSTFSRIRAGRPTSRTWRPVAMPEPERSRAAFGTRAVGRRGGRCRFVHPQGAAGVDLPGRFSELTLAAWVALDAPPTERAYLLASDNWGKRDGQVRWGLDAAGQMQLGVWQKGASSEIRGEPAAVDLSRPGRWMHVALVWNPAKHAASFYLDGQCVGEQPVEAAAILSPGNCRIGTSHSPSGADDSSFRGRIGELLVLRRALVLRSFASCMTLANPTSGSPSHLGVRKPRGGALTTPPLLCNHSMVLLGGV